MDRYKSGYSASDSEDPMSLSGLIAEIYISYIMGVFDKIEYIKLP